jgi:hypothetical protein
MNDKILQEKENDNKCFDIRESHTCAIVHPVEITDQTH